MDAILQNLDTLILAFTIVGGYYYMKKEITQWHEVSRELVEVIKETRTEAREMRRESIEIAKHNRAMDHKEHTELMAALRKDE